MKKLSHLKYLLGLTIPLVALYSFNNHGWRTFLPITYVFCFVPIIELMIKTDAENVPKTEEKKRLDTIIYDLQIYLMVPVQLFVLVTFLLSMQEAGLETIDKTGRIMTMGLCCGVLGINVGHELGHRFKWYEKWMAKINLMTSLNMHFTNEHNNHHHKAVSTPEDPASSRYGEPLFIFWFRSITGVYAWSWKLERERLKRESLPFFSLKNEMLTDSLIQLALLVTIGFFFGLVTVGYFVLAALMGHLILETVNYIEHYGLRREKLGTRYEKVTPQHSWNSDHILGRMLLFELSRHSDHHYRAGRKYQILRHMDASPQMPTGYPGMMVLALFPPLWFAVMNKRVNTINALKKTQATS